MCVNFTEPPGRSKYKTTIPREHGLLWSLKKQECTPGRGYDLKSCHCAWDEIGSANIRQALLSGAVVFFWISINKFPVKHVTFLGVPNKVIVTVLDKFFSISVVEKPLEIHTLSFLLISPYMCFCICWYTCETLFLIVCGACPTLCSHI